MCYFSVDLSTSLCLSVSFLLLFLVCLLSSPPRRPHYVLHPTRLSARPSVPCLRFTCDRKAVETSNLVET